MAERQFKEETNDIVSSFIVIRRRNVLTCWNQSTSHTESYNNNRDNNNNNNLLQYWEVPEKKIQKI